LLFPERFLRTVLTNPSTNCISARNWSTWIHNLNCRPRYLRRQIQADLPFRHAKRCHYICARPHNREFLNTPVMSSIHTQECCFHM
jgi:hypothetical protein